jgi:hypothetical protein
VDADPDWLSSYGFGQKLLFVSVPDLRGDRMILGRAINSNQSGAMYIRRLGAFRGSEEAGMVRVDKNLPMIETSITSLLRN